MREMFRGIWRSTGVQQSLLTVAGNLTATGLSAVALILITRFLGPEKFGIFTVGFSLSLILNRLNDAGLNTVILKFASSAKNDRDRSALYAATLRYKLILSGILLLAGLAFSAPLAGFLNLSEPSIVVMALLVSFATTYFEHLISVLQSVHFFTQAVVAAILASVFKLGVGLALWVFPSAQVVSIYAWYMVGPLLPLLFSGWLAPKNALLALRAPNTALRNKIFGLSKHASVALISAGIIENVDVLFLQKHLDSYETGLYGGVSKIALLFGVVAYSLANVLDPRVARYKTKAHLTSYLKKAWGVVGLATLGFLAFLPVAHFLLIWTIGPEYLAGLPILWMLTGASFLAIAAVPFIALFYSLDANWYFSVSGVLQLAIVLVGNAVFVPLYGLEAAAWTRLAVRAFLLIFSAGLGIVLVRRQYAKA